MQSHSTVAVSRQDAPTWIDRQAPRLALALAVAWTVAAVAIALQLRPYEYCCEYDRYHEMADTLLSARWPRDPFRPAGFVALTATLGFVSGDCFAAAKTIAAVAGGATIYATYLLGVATAGRAIGLTAAVITSCNPVLQQWSLTAAPDTLFTLGMTLIALAITRHRSRPTIASACWLGVTLAAAWFTRYQAIAVAPVAIWTVTRSGAERWRHVTAFAAAVLAGLAPHFAISLAQFGRPLHDENWRNLALRHFGRRDDWAYLYDNPFDGMWSVLAHDPALMAANTAEEIVGLASHAMTDMLAPGLASPWRHALLVATAFGSLLAWRRHRAIFAPVAAAALCYLAVVSTTFYALNRILLPVLPACSIAIAFALADTPHGAGVGSSRFVNHLRAAASCGFLGVLATNGVARTIAFLDHQHHQVVATARQLVAASPQPPAIATNFEFLDRHVACRRVPLAITTDTAAVWAQVERCIRVEQVAYVVVSRIDQPEPFAALIASPTPDRLRRTMVARDVVVYAVR